MEANNEVIALVKEWINEITEDDPWSDPQERIKQLTDMIFKLEDLAEPHNQVISMINKELKPAQEELLDLMIMNDIKSFEDAQGRGKISWSVPIRAGITDAKEFFLALRERGDDAIAKLQIGPDVVTEELLEKIKNSKPGDLKIGMQWNSLLAYAKSIIEEAAPEDDKRVKEDKYMDEKYWIKGMKMDQGDPNLKIKKSKGA
jgi:hypothetical protein